MNPEMQNVRTGSGLEPIRLVYIMAASHSGSTLLAMLLNSHPEICTVGELKATSLGDPDSYYCSCRNKIRECAATWQNAGFASISRMPALISVRTRPRTSNGCYARFTADLRWKRYGI